MILHGQKKKVLKEVIKYYVDTTGNKYNDFILDLEAVKVKPTNELTYPEWLSMKSFELLSKHGITLADCIENKDIINAAINEESSRQEGEFYTPEVWCKDGRTYLEDMLGDLWGKAYVWDASCYSMDTEILTKDNGWVSYNELKDTDQVLSLNPQTLETEFMGFFRRFTKTANKFLEIDVVRHYNFSGYGWSDGVDLKVTLDHKMCVRVDGEIKLMSAQDLYNRLEASFYVPEGKQPSEKIFEIPVYTKNYEKYSSEEVVRYVRITFEDVAIVNREEEKVWDISLERNHVFLVRRNGKPSFCGNCGTGNLMRTANYPKDKMFMSSLLPEDIDMIKSTPEYEGVEAFQLDFLNGIDWDEYNMHFSENLPPRLREVLENDEPILFYMNPPYKVMEANSSDVGSYMASNGMAKCALDIFHQFMYRLIMLKRTYNLSNMFLGIFGPVTMFHSQMIEPLYNEFKEEFKFVDGMCFDAGDFANTSESVGWIVGYTVWRTKKEGEEDKSIVLEAKTFDQDNNITVIGKRLITAIDENLHDWVNAKDIIRKDRSLPMVTTFTNFLGTIAKAPPNALGYLMSSNYVIRATRRACVTTLPNPDNKPITEENFWRSVASFVARRCYASKSNPYNNCQYYSKPDTSIEGYEEWLVDALIVFLFDYSSHQSAYRDVEIDKTIWNINNPMFPIDVEVVKQVATDPNILEDIEKNPPNNHFILNILEQVKDKLSPEAMELYEFALQTILESLQGTARADYDYQHWTNAWDAGLLQIRSVKGLLPDDHEEKYSYLLSRLKHKLYDDIYKFGFLMDTAFAVEDENTLEEDFEEEEIF